MGKLARIAALVALLTLAPAAATPAVTLEWSVGVKGGGGVDLWLAPDNAPDWTNVAPLFSDDTTGWSYGGGPFAELRILTYLAFEIDVLFFEQERVEETAWSVGPGRIDTRLRWTGLRVPILVKGVLPLGATRLWLGAGPEVAVGITSSTEVDVRENPTTPPPNITSHTVTDVYFLTTLGAAFALDPLTLTLEARVAYNLTQPADFRDRVDYDEAVREMSLRAASTLDMRLLVGLAYDF